MSTSQNKAQLEQVIDQQRELIQQVAAERDEARNQRDEVTMERDLLQASLLDPSWKRTEGKPMRLRILELPVAVDGDTDRTWTPFVFVLDRVPEDREIFAEVLTVPSSSGTLLFRDEVQLGEDPWQPWLAAPPPDLRQSAGQPLPAELWPRLEPPAD